MEQILEYIKQNGLPVFIIATCIIAIVGTLKLCKVFDKISSKNVKKFIYYILDIALSFGSSAIYFAIFKLNFNDYLIFSVSQISSTTALYALYGPPGIDLGDDRFFQFGSAFHAEYSSCWYFASTAGLGSTSRPGLSRRV